MLFCSACTTFCSARHKLDRQIALVIRLRIETASEKCRNPLAHRLRSDQTGGFVTQNSFCDCVLLRNLRQLRRWKVLIASVAAPESTCSTHARSATLPSRALRFIPASGAGNGDSVIRPSDHHYHALAFDRKRSLIDIGKIVEKLLNVAFLQTRLRPQTVHQRPRQW